MYRLIEPIILVIYPSIINRQYSKLRHAIPSHEALVKTHVRNLETGQIYMKLDGPAKMNKAASKGRAIILKRLKEELSIWYLIDMIRNSVIGAHQIGYYSKTWNTHCSLSLNQPSIQIYYKQNDLTLPIELPNGTRTAALASKHQLV